MNAAPDAGLVASTLAGNEDSFTLLVERHRPRIRRVAHSLLGDWAEAEDVAQDTLLVAHATLERLRDPERFGAWLAAIATNLAMLRLRSVPERAKSKPVMRIRPSVPISMVLGVRLRWTTPCACACARALSRSLATRTF